MNKSNFFIIIQKFVHFIPYYILNLYKMSVHFCINKKKCTRIFAGALNLAVY